MGIQRRCSTSILRRTCRSGWARSWASWSAASGTRTLCTRLGCRTLTLQRQMLPMSLLSLLSHLSERIFEFSIQIFFLFNKLFGCSSSLCEAVWQACHPSTVRTAGRTSYSQSTRIWRGRCSFVQIFIQIFKHHPSMRMTFELPQSFPL